MALEIMSPAGSLESVTAAVRGGADAVYFGAGDFNARRNAKNLSDEELAEAIKILPPQGRQDISYGKHPFERQGAFKSQIAGREAYPDGGPMPL